MILIGGPVYDSRLSVMTAGHVGALAAQLGKLGIGVGFTWQRSSHVADGRERLLRSAIAQGAKMLVTIDADTWADLTPELAATLEMALSIAVCASDDERADIAVVGLPVGQRDGRINVWAEPGRRATAEEMSGHGARPVYAVGAAYQFIMVDWFRRHAAPGDSWYAHLLPESEDHAFCRRIKQVGGRVLVGNVTTYHAPVGEPQAICYRFPRAADA